jgi:large conductance mechanosensitive channel
MFKEFKEFAIRGNVLDLAVAVVIGAAFGKVVTSFVEDILMPPIGRLTGRADFSSMFISLNGQHYNSIAAAKAAGAPTINYGLFINSVTTFLIVAFTVFLLLRPMNRFKAKPGPAPASKECPRCFTAIPLKATRCPNCTSELAA